MQLSVPRKDLLFEENCMTTIIYDFWVIVDPDTVGLNRYGNSFTFDSAFVRVVFMEFLSFRKEILLFSLL